MKLRSTLIILFLIVLSPKSKADNYQEIVDLTQTCYFNNNGESLPYVKGNGLNPDAIHFYLNLNRYSGKQLLINHQYPFAVFIEGELKKFANEQTSLIWKIDSLQEVLGKEEILITIFSSLKNYDEMNISVSRKILLAKVENDIYKVEVKLLYNRSEQLIIFIFILIFLAIILNTNIKAFLDFYAIDLFIIGRVKDESIFKSKLFSQGNLIIYIFHSMVLSFLIVLLDTYGNIDFGFKLAIFNSFITNWILYSFFVLCFFLLKFLLIKYLGLLFDLASAAKYYFYEFMRMSMIYFLIIFTIASLFIISFPSKGQVLVNVGLYVTLVFMSFRFVVIFIRIGKLASFKKVHLFSYLCTTESIPILIGLKYLIF